MDTKSESKQRIKYIDAMRGLTMTLVVLGHVLMLSFNLGGYESIIGTFFLTFRMPMFFFISGYIAYKSTERWSFPFFAQLLKKKSFVQIVPALLFFTLYSLCFTNNHIEILPNHILKYGFGGYWFTFVLFEMFCIYFTASLASRFTKHWIVDIVLAACSLLGILWLVASDRQGSLCNVLCIENLSKYMQFFTFGILCKKYNKQFLSLINNDRIKAFIILSFIIGFYFYYDSNLKANSPMLFALNHDIAIRYSGLLTVFIFFLSKKEYFNENNHVSLTLQYVGKRTLDIYLLHLFFVPSIPFITPYINGSSMTIIQLTLSLIITIIVIAICLLCSEVIRTSNTLAHFCFGVSKNK